VLRVLLDATAVPADRRGVGRYVDNLVPALARAGVEIRVACQPQDVEHYGVLSGTDPLLTHRVTSRRPIRLVWEQLAFPALVRRASPDVLHSPHYTHPVAVRVPFVVTLHDATFFTDPQVHTRIKGPFFRAATRLALRRAGCCVVPSKASAGELVRHAHADPARLQVAHLGVDTALFAPPSPATVAAVRAQLGIAEDQPWIAFLGTLEPRKNVPALVRAWTAAALARPDPPALVLAGGAGWDAELDAVAAAVPSQLTLLRPGYLPAELLAGLLGGAEVVAYPTLGEGFGLPVLEAMACGAAVLTTRRLAIPEVGGDAVAYTEPSAEAISAALTALLDDPARRAALRRAGIVRAAGFTWDACAASHITAYERALARTR
jgi:glycosyltransferase involved in cell wall biosynthesis